MRIQILSCSIIATILIFCSCSKNEVSSIDLLKYVNNEKSGLIQNQSNANFNFKAKYCPLTYQIAQAIQLDKGKKHTLGNISQAYEGNHFINFQISSNSVKTMKMLLQSILQTNDINPFINKLSFHNKDNFQLVIGSTEIAPALYHVEAQSMNLNGLHLSVVFPDENNIVGTSHQKDIVFKFRNATFNENTLEFEFGVADLNNIPDLEILNQQQLK